LFEKGFPRLVYVSDCLPAQLKTESKSKQLCIAHLQRELANFIDVFDCTFSSQLTNLIHQAIELKYRLPDTKYALHKNTVKYFRTKLDKLLDDDHDEKDKKYLHSYNDCENTEILFLHSFNILKFLPTIMVPKGQ
jgi:hypothetical protein